MPLFKKKCPVFEAVQYNGKNGDHLHQWSNGFVIESPVLEPTEDNPTGAYLQITTEKVMNVGIVGDWIIKGTRGEYYPCKPDVFETTYEFVGR